MRRQRAFTLVELLVVITIIAILAGLALGVVGLARESGRAAATRATLAKINRALRPIRDEVWARRLPADPTSPLTGKADPKTVANMRRELLLIEMPDRWSDITRDPMTFPLQITTSGGLVYTIENGDPTTWGRPLPARAYPATYRSLAACRIALQAAIKRLENRGLSPTEIQGKLASWESAECLYLIVTIRGLDQDISWLPSERGDADQDGLLEFHDAWGQPIAFLRWPAGYPGACPTIPTSGPGGIGDGIYPIGADQLGPVPLAYSAGPDGQFDINRGVQANGADWVTYEYRLDGYGNLNPWTADLQGNLIGLPLDSTSPTGEPADGSEGWQDNLTTWQP